METQSSAWLEAPGGQRYPVQGGCSFGRAPGNTVVLANENVSRRHAMVHAQGSNEYWVVDLGSANGTYLNGRRVAQPCRLSDNDALQIAGHTFRFRSPKSAVRANDPATMDEKTIQDVKSVSCWLLVADIQGSTEFTRKLPPEEAPRVTGRWLAQCKQAVDENAGMINKFLGDGFLAYWEDAQDSAPHVAKTVRRLAAMQEQGAPRFRVVLHRGKVFVGGGGSMGEESLLGNEVNFVFRMEKLAASLGLSRLMSEPAAANLKPHLALGEETRQRVPGFEGDFAFFEFDSATQP